MLTKGHALGADGGGLVQFCNYCPASLNDIELNYTL